MFLWGNFHFFLTRPLACKKIICRLTQWNGTGSQSHRVEPCLSNAIMVIMITLSARVKRWNLGHGKIVFLEIEIESVIKFLTKLKGGSKDSDFQRLMVNLDKRLMKVNNSSPLLWRKIFQRPPGHMVRWVLIPWWNHSLFRSIFMSWSR